MKSLFRRLLLVPAFFTCLTIHFGGAAKGADLDEAIAKATLVKTNEAAPDFTCQTTDGRTIRLSALKGKVVLLYFFSTSVGACITEMKYLQTEVFEKLADREDFQLIGIGRGHSREELVKAGGENKLTFPLVPDPGQEIYQRYFNKYVPRTVVVRKDGSIALLVSGYHEYNGVVELQGVLARALTEGRR